MIFDATISIFGVIKKVIRVHSIRNNFTRDTDREPLEFFKLSLANYRTVLKMRCYPAFVLAKFCGFPSITPRNWNKFIPRVISPFRRVDIAIVQYLISALPFKDILRHECAENNDNIEFFLSKFLINTSLECHGVKIRYGRGYRGAECFQRLQPPDPRWKNFGDHFMTKLLQARPLTEFLFGVSESRYGD